MRFLLMICLRFYLQIHRGRTESIRPLLHSCTVLLCCFSMFFCSVSLLHPDAKPVCCLQKPLIQEPPGCSHKLLRNPEVSLRNAAGNGRNSIAR